MSILRAMYTGVTGITTEGEALGIVGDNIANVNTTGFKQQRGAFGDLLGRSVTAGTTTALPGTGVNLTKIQQVFTQGTMTNTGIATDLALNGDGFLVVHGTVDGVTGSFYTRAGQISVDKDGVLVNPNGLSLQGYQADATGTIASAALSSLRVPTGSVPPFSTTTLSITANLNASADTPTLPFSADNPTTTSNFSTSITVYDSLGAGHSVSFYFRKSADNAWEYNALVDGGELAGGTAGSATLVGNGTLTFSTTGALQAMSETTPISIDFQGARPGQNIALSFGSPIADGGTGLTGVTQFSSPSNVSSQSQNGYASGDLAGLSVDADGLVKGIYTNGQKLAIGALAIAKFRSNVGLGRAGQNLWIETRDSGVSALGAAGSGGRGAVASGALEGSNVDIAQQFVDLIAHQRAFQANSKTITTADEMLQELVNIKR